MDIKESFKNAYNRIVNKDIYWPAVIMNIIFNITAIFIGGILLISLIGLFGTNDINLETLTIKDIMSPGIILGSLSLITFFGLFVFYLSKIQEAFIFKRIINESKKNITFFEGFKESFLIGLKLTLGALLISLLILILVILLLLISLIPFVGVIFVILLLIPILPYLVLLVSVLNAKIAKRGPVLDSFIESIKLGFRKPILVLYSLIYLAVLILLSVIIAITASIPILGIIMLVFMGPLQTIYIASMSLDFANE